MKKIETLLAEAVDSSAVVKSIGKEVSKYSLATVYAFEDLMDVVGKKDTLFDRVTKVVTRTAKEAVKGDAMQILKLVGVTIVAALSFLVVLVSPEKVKEMIMSAGKYIGTGFKNVANAVGGFAETAVANAMVWIEKAAEHIWLVIEDSKVVDFLKTFATSMTAAYKGASDGAKSLWGRFKAKVGISDSEDYGDETFSESEQLLEGKVETYLATFIVSVVAIAVGALLAYAYKYVSPMVEEAGKKLLANINLPKVFTGSVA